jgi:hypothetical protein
MRRLLADVNTDYMVDDEQKYPKVVNLPSWMKTSSQTHLGWNSEVSDLNRPAFVLNLDDLSAILINENSNVTSLKANDQSVLTWDKKFGKAVISKIDMIEFGIHKGLEFKIYKAFYIGSNTTNLGNGKSLWSGLVGENRNIAEIEGDFSCYTEFETLACECRIFGGNLRSSSAFYIRGDRVIIETNSIWEEEEKIENEEDGGVAGDVSDFITTSGSNRLLQRLTSDGMGHALETTKGADRGTELIVFYTEEAGDGEYVENQIKKHVNLFNDALRAKGVNNRRAYIRLVSIWGLFSNDYKTWIGSQIDSNTRDEFFRNMDPKRRLVGADIMILIHDWNIGCGKAKFNSPHSIIDIHCIHQHTFQHELGHTFGLLHSDANSSLKTLMKQKDKINMWSDVSAKSFNLELNQHRFDHVWNYMASKSVSRVQPSIDGNINSWSFRRCPSGIRGLGLTCYREENGGYDYHDMHILCGPSRHNLTVKDIGGTLVYEDTLACNGTGLIKGVALYRNRSDDGRVDSYHIGIICSNSSTWIYSNSSNNTLVDFDWTSNWKVGSSKHLDYIKLNRYREDNGTVDTYSLDVGFDSN